MAVKLVFNSEKFIESFEKEVIKISNEIADSFSKDVSSMAVFSKAKKNNEVINAVGVDTEGVIKAAVINYAWAIMDSYGTGDKMSLHNSEFNKYRSSKKWNPARTGKTIVRRPKTDGGFDIFGKKVKTGSDELAGQPIEVFEFEPSNSIGKALAIYFSSRIRRMTRERLNPFIERKLNECFEVKTVGR